MASGRPGVGVLHVLRGGLSAGQALLRDARGCRRTARVPGRSLCRAGNLVTSPASTPPVSRLRRRGTFGLDERRWPDPERVDAEVRAWLRDTFPEIWVLQEREGAEASGRSMALLLPQGHVAMLRIERRRDAPGRAALDLLDRCGTMRIPVALVSTLDEARAALRRFGIWTMSASPAVPSYDVWRP